MRVAKCN